MASFQKRHYQAIAAIIAEAMTTDLSGLSQAEYIHREMANYFARDNERFNRDTFAAACRGEDYRGKPRQCKE